MDDCKNTDKAIAVQRLSVLVPVYNGGTSIGTLVDEVTGKLGSEYPELEIVLVNDGSVDDSHPKCVEVSEKHAGVVKYIRLARNFGEHNAVMCGLRFVTGDAVAIIDDDFQNPPAEIKRLVDKLGEGYDVVYSYYPTRKDNLFRRFGSAFNDRVATMLINKPRNLYLSSFKVMNRFLIQTVIDYDGPFPYIDGIILRSTGSIAQQDCHHEERRAGQSGYTLRRLVRLWLNMFTGFSITPLRWASFLGLMTSLCGFLLGLYFILSRIFDGLLIKNTIPPGWASLIVCVTVSSGLQLCVLGVLGEYLGRLFLTMNKTPQFVVRETFGVAEDD